MWSKKFEKCTVCGRTDRPHMAKGQCSYCYNKAYQSSPDHVERVRESKRKWYEENGGKDLSKRTREDRWFDGLRQQALERDNHCCQTCGSTTDLVVHHKDGNGRGSQNPNNDLSNLTTSCRICHPKEHSCKRWSRNYDCCQNCGTTEEKHNAKGLCRLCYAKLNGKKST